jgi:hypothetical protein
MAAREQVSRNFLYHQKSKANMTLDRAFAPVQTASPVLF